MVLAAAALFSTGGAAVKGVTLTPWQVAGGRSLIAAVVILILLPDTRRGWRWSYLPVASAYAATMIFFVTATKLTTAANAIFLEDAAPFFVLLLSPLLLKEPVRRSDVAVMLLLACGMGLFFLAHEGARATAPDPARGNVIAAMSAFTWALTLIGLRHIGRRENAAARAGLSIVTLGNLLVAGVALPFAFPLGVVGLSNAAVLLWLGVFQVALAYVCLTRALRSVPAIEATILMMLEPALNPVWTWLIQGETPAALSIAGGFIILAAVAGQAWWRNRRILVR